MLFLKVLCFEGRDRVYAVFGKLPKVGIVELYNDTKPFPLFELGRDDVDEGAGKGVDNILINSI